MALSTHGMNSRKNPTDGWQEKEQSLPPNSDVSLYKATCTTTCAKFQCMAVNKGHVHRDTVIVPKP